MLVRLADGRSTFIDFRERAPDKASHDMYLDAQGNPTRDSIEGWRSAGVPGTVRGFEIAHKKYGKAKWAEMMAARDGARVQGTSPSPTMFAESMKARTQSVAAILNRSAFF